MSQEPAPLRVLIADDSPTARLLLVELFAQDPRFVVVGQAKDGLEVVELTARLRPDVVVMDIHMPGCDGLEATRRIMDQAPTPIVITSSTANVRDVTISLEALRSGALAACPKPLSPVESAFSDEQKKLLETVVLMADVKVVRRRNQPVSNAAPRLLTALPQVVAIVGSTGAPAAIHTILSELPQDFAAPILIVQHIGPGFAAGLVSWLASGSRLHIKLAEQGEPLAPATVYVASEECHMGVARGPNIKISREAPIDGFRPSGTFLFQSVAAAFGARTLAIILSGMGEDGVAGLRDVRRRGGSIIAQDQASSTIFGMPGSAIRAGLADAVLSPVEIAALLRDKFAPRVEP